MRKSESVGKEQTVIFSITEVTVSVGRPRHIRAQIDGELVKIPVSEEVYAYWQEQFVRSNPTHQQRKKFSTIMNLIRAAYEEGLRQRPSVGK
jgi:hypothetical protein